MTTAMADLIVFGAKVTTLDDNASAAATAFAIRGERFPEEPSAALRQSGEGGREVGSPGSGDDGSPDPLGG
jgi:hypothetical protein